MKKYPILICICLLSMFMTSCSEKHQKSDYSIVPMPNKIEPKNGVFTIDDNTSIIYEDKLDSVSIKVVENFAKELSKVTGYNIDAAVGKEKRNSIFFEVCDDCSYEEYSLDISKKDITAKAGDAHGFFYTIQSLKQLLPAEVYGNKTVQGINWSAKCVEIKDKPRFKYRGMHFDVARHMFSVDEVKSFIDLLAMHKMNIFHWHITDDQGWRIEIKKYPKLTEIGAWRNETAAGRPEDNKFDKTPYGGFYTQDQIRDVVAYAAERQITIIPEIDMPGHMVAAVASYPYLGCSGKKCDVRTTWGVSEDVLCVGKESTFEFVKDVLSEVIELFPSEYIHIGGDECPKTRWEKCPNCQKRIKAENIKGDSIHSAEVYLQSYFNNRIEKFLSENGRRLIGWDEILEGDIAQNAIIMSWRGESGGISAAKKGHNVIMTPYTYLYFDYYQTLDTKNEPVAIGGHIPLESVYNYNPIPESLSEEEGSLVLGVQANLWTEYIKDFAQVEYMILPRMDALSEIAWTYPENKDWKGFLNRLDKNVQIYTLNGNNFAKHIMEVSMSFEINNNDDCIDVTLRTQGKAPIYYTVDGSEPTEASLLYEKPVKLKSSTTLKAVSVRNGAFTKTAEYGFDFNKATAKKIKLEEEIDATYRYSGANTLVDGIYGDKAFNTGKWIAFKGNDLVATIDLGSEEKISEVSVGELCDLANWIFPAESFKVEISTDGKNYITVADQKKDLPKGYDGYGQERLQLTANFEPTKVRYIKLRAGSVKNGPIWHDGKNKPMFLFVDEISVK